MEIVQSCTKPSIHMYFNFQEVYILFCLDVILRDFFFSKINKQTQAIEPDADMWNYMDCLALHIM